MNRVRVSAAAQLCAPSVDVRKEGRTPRHTHTERGALPVDVSVLPGCGASLRSAVNGITAAPPGLQEEPCGRRAARCPRPCSRCCSGSAAAQVSQLTST